MRTRKQSLLIAVFCLAGVSFAFGQKPPSEQPDETKVREDWASHRRNFIFLDGKFVKMPRFPDEFFTASTIPGLESVDVGAYGSIAGLNVMQVIDKSSVTAHNITAPSRTPNRLGFVPHNRIGGLVRLAGITTAGITLDGTTSVLAGAALDGKKVGPVAVIGEWEYTADAKGTIKKIPLLVPMSLVKKGLSLEQFKRLMQSGANLGEARDIEVTHTAQLKTTTVTEEQRANSILNIAERHLKDGNKESAARKCKELITAYPKSEAAKKAQELLDTKLK